MRDLYGRDIAAYKAYGNELLPQLENGSLFIPIRATTLDGQGVSAQINGLIYVFVDQGEFKKLLDSVPHHVIYQPFYTQNPWEGPPENNSGAMVVPTEGKLIIISFLRESFYQLPDGKLFALLNIRGISSMAALESLFLPKVGTVAKNDFCAFYFNFVGSICHVYAPDECKVIELAMFE